MPPEGTFKLYLCKINGEIDDINSIEKQYRHIPTAIVIVEITLLWYR